MLYPTLLHTSQMLSADEETTYYHQFLSLDRSSMEQSLLEIPWNPTKPKPAHLKQLIDVFQSKTHYHLLLGQTVGNLQYTDHH